MASKNIRGINIQLGGDTTGLSDALRGVEKETTKLQSELKEIDKGLKLDPGNMDLLAQKSTVLAKEFESVSEKLNILKNSQEQVNAQFAAGQISDEQYRAFEREIVKTSTALSQLSNDLSDTDDRLSNGGKSSEELAKGLDNAGKNVESFDKNLKDTGSGAAELGGKLDDTGKQASVFGDVLKASLSADAIKAGLKGIADAVGGIASAAADGLKALGDLGMKAAGALVNASMSGMQYADNIMETSTKTGLAADTLQAYSYAADMVHVSVETMTGSMAKNIKSMTSATDMTKGVGKAYADLGVTVRNADGSLRDSESVYWDTIDALGSITDETQRDSMAMQIFGKSAQELNPLIQQGSEGIKAFTDEAKFMGAVMSGDTLNSYVALADNMARLDSVQKGLTNNIGTMLLPALTELSGTGVSLLGNFSKAIQDAGTNPEKISAAIGQGLQGISDTIQKYTPIILDAIPKIFDGLQTVINDNMPMLIDIATQLIGLIGQALTAALPSLLTIGGQLIGTLVDAVMAALPEIAAMGMQLLSAIGSSLMDNLPILTDTAMQLLQFLAEGLINAIPQLSSAAIDIIMKLVQMFVDNLPKIIDAGVKMLVALAEGLAKALPQLIPAIVNAVLTIVETLLDNIDMLVDAAIQLITGLAEGLINALPILIEKVPEIIEKLAMAIINNLPKILEAALQIVIALADAIIKNLPKIYTAAGEIIGALIGGIIKLNYKIRETILDLIKQIFQWFTDKDWGQIGKDILQGLINGIKGAISGVINAVKEVSGDILGAVKSFFGIRSPSSVMEDEIGKQMALGWAAGVDKNGKKIENATEKVAKASYDAAKKWIDQKTLDEELGLQDQLDAWEYVASQYDKNTTQRIAAEKEAARLRKSIQEQDVKSTKAANQEITDSNKQLYDALSKQIEDRKKNNQLSLSEELAAWRAVQAKLVAGTEQRTAAEQKAMDARQAITEQITKLNDDYNKSLDQTADKILNSFGLFDTVTSDTEKKVTGSGLIDALQSQVKAVQQWTVDMSKLTAKGLDDQLISMLYDMGPKAAAEVQAIMQMSDAELTRYNDLFERKQKLARMAATASLSDARDETIKQTQELKDALSQDDAVMGFAVKADFSGVDEANKAALELFKQSEPAWNEQGGAIVTSISAGLDDAQGNLLDSAKQLGSDTMDGFAQGLYENATEPLNAAREIAGQVADVMASALGVSSPSKITQRIGRFVAEGLAVGMLDSVGLVNRAAQKLGLAAEPSVSQNARGSAANASGSGGAPVISINNNFNGVTADTVPHLADRANSALLRRLTAGLAV